MRSGPAAFLRRAMAVAVVAAVLGACSGDDDTSSDKSDKSDKTSSETKPGDTSTTGKSSGTPKSVCDAAKDASKALKSGASTKTAFEAKRDGWAELAATLPAPYQTTAEAIVVAYDASLATLDENVERVDRAFVEDLGKGVSPQLEASVSLAKYVHDECDLVLPGYKSLLE